MRGVAVSEWGHPGYMGVEGEDVKSECVARCYYHRQGRVVCHL